MFKKTLFVFVLALFGCVTQPETGKKTFLLISEGEEMRLGDQAYRQVLSENKISQRKDWNEALQRVGQRISAVAQRPQFQWEFKLIESPEKNAFCLPGGKVAVYTGIFPILKNEAGMATVIGHEVAHATLRHGGQRVSAQMGTQLGVLVLGQILMDEKSSKRQWLMAALGLGTQVGVLLPFSRSNETEADAIGLRYMAQAGYDPREAPLVWQRFGTETKVGGPVWLSTHPESGSRQKALEQLIPQELPRYEKSPQFGKGVDF